MHRISPARQVKRCTLHATACPRICVNLRHSAGRSCWTSNMSSDAEYSAALARSSPFSVSSAGSTTRSFSPALAAPSFFRVTSTGMRCNPNRFCDGDTIFASCGLYCVDWSRTVFGWAAERSRSFIRRRSLSAFSMCVSVLSTAVISAMRGPFSSDSSYSEGTRSADSVGDIIPPYDRGLSLLISLPGMLSRPKLWEERRRPPSEGRRLLQEDRRGTLGERTPSFARSVADESRFATSSESRLRLSSESRGRAKRRRVDDDMEPRGSSSGTLSRLLPHTPLSNDSISSFKACSSCAASICTSFLRGSRDRVRIGRAVRPTTREEFDGRFGCIATHSSYSGTIGSCPH
eukprot:Rhum_TRINITY_DN456_c1_g1::Rhum_TRINITY_DN456_c1_g1_i1::g.1392::m.1392